MKRILTSIIAISIAIVTSAQWSPAGKEIKSPWAEEVNPGNVLPEYPRPQMVRQAWSNLNGLWNYAITSVEADDFTPEGQILVPFAVESSLSGVGRRITKENSLWYERTFVIPSKWKGKNILLHFGGVDWKSEVFVNGQFVGEHKGGYDPFTYDITPYIKKSGKQTITVKVFDASDNSMQPRGKQCIVNTGIWYTPVSGIWQTVWIEPVGDTYIADYYPIRDLQKSQITVDVQTVGAQDGDMIKVQLLEGAVGYDPQKPSQTVLAEAITVEGKAVLPVVNVKTWSPDNPYLYGIRISVLRKGKVLDTVEGYTAMRSIEAKKDSSPNRYKRLALNGECLFQYGPLDQGWWPDGLYTAPCDEALKFDIVKTKEMGYNMIRKHIKVEPARWYYWCDVLGMMVWQDMPCIGDYSKKQLKARDEDIQKCVNNKWSKDSIFGGTECEIPQVWKDNYYNEWKNIMTALRGFQSIVCWVPFNEAWGQFDTPEVVKFTKEFDPTRLVNEASGGNFHFVGDIIDVHHYPTPAMNVFESKFINVLGEYGGIGYPVIGHTWEIDRKWGYGKNKQSSEELMSQYKENAEMLKVFVQTGCAAAVYTQTTDVEGEVNGLMTYDRAVIKVDIEKLAEINRSVIESMSK